jgi:hypothetical protein
MGIPKPTIESSSSPKQPDSGRRSFIRKAGAAVSAVLASAAAGVSKPKADPDTELKDQIGRLSKQIGCLEDAMAIRRLHQAYESHLDKGMYEEAVRLFTDDAEVIYNGGLFTGRDKGVRRLYCDRFGSGFTGKTIEPAPGFEPDSAQSRDSVDVAPDRKSARAQFPYSMQVGIPMPEDSQLVTMARLQGEGILKWWEGGILEASYVKDAGGWKIKRLVYRTVSSADYRPGRPYARTMEVPLFSTTFPADPSGPDKLVSHPEAVL